MRRHINADEPFVREDVSVDQALERFRAEGQDYKVELIEDLVSNADPPRRWTPSASTPTARSPTSAAGRTAPARSASRRSSCSPSPAPTGAATPSRQQLTRIYGTAFFSKEDLAQHLERLEQAKARDHRRLGPELGLFTFSEVAPGTRILATQRHDALQRARRAQPRDGGRARLHRGQDAAALRQRAVEDVGPLGQVPRAHVRHRDRGPGVRHQADELPRARTSLQACRSGPTATCRCATPSPGCCIATSPAARCTACCACATSPRMTRTSSAPRSRCRRR